MVSRDFTVEHGIITERNRISQERTGFYRRKQDFTGVNGFDGREQDFTVVNGRERDFTGENGISRERTVLHGR